MNRVLWATVILAGPVDILLTLSNWHHEGNPVVLALGPVGMVAVKVVALGALVLLWRETDVRESFTARVCLWALCYLYAAVAVTNVAVLVA
jgi:hypothetical protein